MTGTYAYRRATLSDVEGLKSLGVAAYGRLANQLADAEWQKMRGNLAGDFLWSELLSQSSGFLCTADDAIVGMAFLVPRGIPNELFDASWSHLRLVGVHPDHERRGLARRLTEQCIAEAKRLGEKVIALHTSEKMTAARGLYESLGFTIHKEIPERFGMRYWIYKLDLS